MINEDSAQKLRRVDLRLELPQVLALSENYPTSHFALRISFSELQVFVCAQCTGNLVLRLDSGVWIKISPNARADCRCNKRVEIEAINC
jgi:hypothetical protein